MERDELAITAHLARLELSPEETADFQRAVFQMLDYFSKMREVDVEGLPPTAQMVTHNRVRPDAPAEGRGAAEVDRLLANAPELEDRFIVIPNVL
jgi:aspartyl-tRNA(Asn)/glutamyl-tRNA(Gln) amidotransferase subunit C